MSEETALFVVNSDPFHPDYYLTSHVHMITCSNLLNHIADNTANVFKQLEN